MFVFPSESEIVGNVVIEAIEHLLIDPDHRLQMALDARIAIETTWPDWTDVLAEGLMPVWRDVGNRYCKKWRTSGRPPRADRRSWLVSSTQADDVSCDNYSGRPRRR